MSAMGFGDYERGKQNPFELPGSGPINWDFQQGQMDELKRMQDQRNGVLNGVPAGPVSSTASYAGACVPARRLPKSLIAALVLPLLFGPLGLFYASMKGALIVIGLLLAGPMITGTVDNASVMAPALAFSYFVSIAWSVISVIAHNRSVSAHL